MKIPAHYKLAGEQQHYYALHDERDGKKFHIAKANLSNDMHKQIKGLPAFSDGGTALNSDAIDVSNNASAPSGDDSTLNGLPKADVTPEDAPLNPKLISSLAYKGKPKSFAETLGLGSFAADNDYSTLDPAMGTQVPVPANPEQQVVDQATEPPAGVAAPQVQSPRTPAQATPGQAGTAPGVGGYGQEEINALRAGAAAEGKAGQKEASAWDQYNQKLAYQPTASDVFQKGQAKDQELEQAFASKKIDPDRYWKTQNTGQKISAGLAMLFGAIGAAQGGTANYALNSINKSIDNDIEAQKEDKSSAMNLWKMNRDRTQSDMQATALTQNQNYAAVLGKINQYKAEAAGPVASARIAPAEAEIKQKQAMNNMYLAMSGGANQGDENSFGQKLSMLQRFNPSMYKDLEAKYLPGVGVAKIPVPEKEREAMAKMSDFKSKVNEAINFQLTQSGAGGAWSPTNRADASRMKNDLISSYNDVKGLNRFTGEEAKLYEGIIGDIGSVNPSGSVATNLEHLKRGIDNKEAIQARAYGVVPFQASRGAGVRVMSPDGKTGTLAPGHQLPAGWKAI